MYFYINSRKSCDTKNHNVSAHVEPANMSQQWNHENQFIPWRLTWPLQEKRVEPTSLFLAMLCLDLRLLDGWKNIQTYSQNDKYDHESSGKQQQQSNITKTYTQVPVDSKWPFYQFVWKSLNLGKGHLTIPKRSHRIARPKYVCYMYFFGVSILHVL